MSTRAALLLVTLAGCTGSNTTRTETVATTTAVDAETVVVDAASAAPRIAYTGSETVRPMPVLPPLEPATTPGPSAPGVTPLLRPPPIRQMILSRFPLFEACLTAPANAPAYPAGRVTLSFVIATDGTISTATVSQSPTGLPEEARQCLIEEVRTMVFPQLHNGNIVMVNYPLMISP